MVQLVSHFHLNFLFISALSLSFYIPVYVSMWIGFYYLTSCTIIGFFYLLSSMNMEAARVSEMLERVIRLTRPTVSKITLQT